MIPITFARVRLFLHILIGVAGLVTPADAQDPLKLQLRLEPQFVQFSTPANDVLTWRLQVRTVQDRSIFDSGFVIGDSLTWAFVNAQGEAVEAGVYNYTVTIRGAGPDKIREGQWVIQRTGAGYGVWAATDQQAIASDGETTIAVSGTAEMPSARAIDRADGTRGGSSSLPKNLGTMSFGPVQPYISGTGSTYSVTRWYDGPNGVLGDTAITEVNGLVLIGNDANIGNLQIYGQPGSDVFAGMGKNLVTGPGFNFGYAGGSFGRSAGFFNVRPDAQAVPPNPSLRFMTANVERMIITNSGRIGIGTSTPLRTIQIGADTNALFTLDPSDASPNAGYIRFGDHTGWSLIIARQRESSGAALNTGITGTLVRIRDDAAFFLNGFPLGATGTTPLCRTLSNAITFCEASSLRYKTDVKPFRSGLAILNRLRPVSFTRIHNGSRDIGFIAEEVARVDPVLTYPNDEGEVEGIRYNELTPIFVNAFREQQAQIRKQDLTIRKQQTEIARQQATVTQLQKQIDEMRRLVCLDHAAASICK